MLKKIFKFFGLAIVLWVVLLMSFRIYTVNHYPPTAEGIVPTDSLKAAYAAGTLDAETWEARTLYDGRDPDRNTALQQFPARNHGRRLRL